MRNVTLALFALFLAACHAGTKGTAAASSPRAAGGSDALPEVRVFADGGPYLFSYYASDGKIHDADALSAVPVEARREVLVRDLSRTAGQLHSDEYLYLADLRGEAPLEGYPTSVVSRYQFEAQGDVGSDQLPETDGGTSEGVIVYGTSWCGACKAARQHLKERHIPYVEKDVEQDAAAAQELARKAKRAGLKLGGVPVIDVGGQLMMGYDPASLDRAWAQAQR